MIERVYRQASLVLDDVWVATDDERIREAVISFGGRAVMTRTTHRSGTDRCAEAAATITDGHKESVIINIQGDEPFIRPDQIRALTECFSDPAVNRSASARVVLPLLPCPRITTFLICCTSCMDTSSE